MHQLFALKYKLWKMSKPFFGMKSSKFCMKFLTSGKYLVSLARRAASTRSVLENRKCTLTLSLRKSQTLSIEVESRQDLRTGSGFARTNLALVVCTRSRGDALGGETDMSNQNPRYGFGNPKCVSHSFLFFKVCPLRPRPTPPAFSGLLTACGAVG